MRKTLIALLLGLTATFGFAAEDVPPHPYIEIVTTEGTIILELDGKQAPLTVGHFLALVDSGFYDGVVFHRVIPGFMLQGGGFSQDMQKKPGLAPVKNEADNGLKNDRGTIAMARTQDPHSASSQFFINTVDNAFLNYKGQTTAGWGYAVFGKVIKGMEVVDAISRVETGTHGRFRDVPQTPVVIIKMHKKTP